MKTTNKYLLICIKLNINRDDLFYEIINRKQWKKIYK